MSKRKRIAETVQDGFNSRSEKRRIGWQIRKNKLFPVVIFETGEVRGLREVETIKNQPAIDVTLKEEVGRHLVDGDLFEELTGEVPHLPRDVATPEQIEQLT